MSLPRQLPIPGSISVSVTRKLFGGSHHQGLRVGTHYTVPIATRFSTLREAHAFARSLPPADYAIERVG